MLGVAQAQGRASLPQFIALPHQKRFARHARLLGDAEPVAVAGQDFAGKYLATVFDALAVKHNGERSAIVTWSVPGVDPSAVVDAANNANITINASTAAFARLDMGAKNQMSVVRAAPHIYNTTEELDRLIDVVAKLV